METDPAGYVECLRRPRRTAERDSERQSRFASESKGVLVCVASRAGGDRRAVRGVPSPGRQWR
jgi:hypothetical protein